MFETTVPPCVRNPSTAPANEPRWTLVVAVLGSSMAFLDSTFVGVALPVMQRELGVAMDRAQWIVEAYLLLLSSLVLVGGALGDCFGRRRVFVVGAMLFAVASLGCGVAPGPSSLILARAVQGVGAACLVPGSLALISAAYPERAARDAAIGTWSAASAIVSACGPVVGGWVVANASWRWLFLVNVPIAAVVVVVARRRVSETRDDRASTRVDVAGATLITLGLGLVVYALVAAGRSGAAAGFRVFGPLGAGVVLLGLFVLIEARSAAPMVPLSLFRVPTFAGANLLTLLIYGALGAALFFVPFNLIQVQGYTPSAAGAALLPFVVLISAMSRPVGALSGRIGARTPLVIGSVFAAVGFVLLAAPTVGGSYLHTFFPGIAVLGVGMGFIVAPLSAAVMGSVDVRHAGVASGINNAVARAAGLLAVAGLGVIVTVRFDMVLHERLSTLSLSKETAMAMDGARSELAAAEPPVGAPPALRASIRHAVADAYVAGFRDLMLTCAGLSAASALVAFATIRRDNARARGS